MKLRRQLVCSTGRGSSEHERPGEHINDKRKFC